MFLVLFSLPHAHCSGFWVRGVVQYSVPGRPGDTRVLDYSVFVQNEKWLIRTEPADTSTVTQQKYLYHEAAFDGTNLYRIPKDTTLLEYAAGQSRDHARDFSFCKSKSFAVVRIENPFILKPDWNYKQLKRFLEIPFPLMAVCPAKIELRTRVGEEPDQKRMIQDLEKWLKGKGATFSFQLVPVFGFGKNGFHDRRLVFQPEQSNPKKRITVLMTGGIDRYLDAKFDCSIVIQT